jgi:predicted O-methyltransferase YrrM
MPKSFSLSLDAPPFGPWLAEEDRVTHEFSSDWFSWNVEVWKSVLSKLPLVPSKVLEIGCFEGRSTTWMIEHLLGPDGGQVFCVDAWDGIPAAEAAFDKNIQLSLARRPDVFLQKLKGYSSLVLPELVSSHHDSFDLIYVDGSHDAADVLFDLTCAFQLCRSGGLLICDDYLWNFGDDLCSTPKLAVDSFVNCYAKRLTILRAPLYQVFLVKQ